MIDPMKDLDGISPVNIAKVFSRDSTGFAPCTAEAVMNALKLYDIPVAGKERWWSADRCRTPPVYCCFCRIMPL